MIFLRQFPMEPLTIFNVSFGNVANILRVDQEQLWAPHCVPPRGESSGCRSAHMCRMTPSENFVTVRRLLIRCATIRTPNW
jgi:hypothetical protein